MKLTHVKGIRLIELNINQFDNEYNYFSHFIKRRIPQTGRGGGWYFRAGDLCESGGESEGCDLHDGTVTDCPMPV